MDEVDHVLAEGGAVDAVGVVSVFVARILCLQGKHRRGTWDYAGTPVTLSQKGTQNRKTAAALLNNFMNCGHSTLHRVQSPWILRFLWLDFLFSLEQWVPASEQQTLKALWKVTKRNRLTDTYTKVCISTRKILGVNKLKKLITTVLARPGSNGNNTMLRMLCS